MAPHSSTLAWKIPWTEEPGRLQSTGSRRVGHDWATSLSLFTLMYWSRNGTPLQYSCLENPRDVRAWGAWLKRLSSAAAAVSNTDTWDWQQFISHGNSVQGEGHHTPCRATQRHHRRASEPAGEVGGRLCSHGRLQVLLGSCWRMWLVCLNNSTNWQGSEAHETEDCIGCSWSGW